MYTIGATTGGGGAVGNNVSYNDVGDCSGGVIIDYGGTERYRDYRAADYNVFGHSIILERCEYCNRRIGDNDSCPGCGAPA